MKISITAKCSDMFSARLSNAEGNYVGNLYYGYVPDFFPGEHYGDYVQLDIDVASGRILNWKKPTLKELEKTFGCPKRK